MVADEPCKEVVGTHGESTMCLLITTFSTLSPITAFVSLVKGSKNCLELFQLLYLVIVRNVQTLLDC